MVTPKPAVGKKRTRFLERIRLTHFLVILLIAGAVVALSPFFPFEFGHSSDELSLKITNVSATCSSPFCQAKCGGERYALSGNCSSTNVGSWNLVGTLGDFDAWNCFDSTWTGPGTIMAAAHCVEVGDHVSFSSYSECGNLVIESGEQCDGKNINGFACSNFGFSLGTLSCNPSGTPTECTYNTSSCSNPAPTFCGDNMIQSPNDAGVNEGCDGIDLGGLTCADFLTDAGYPLEDGELKCQPDCLDYDIALCEYGPSSCAPGLTFCANGVCCFDSTCEACGSIPPDEDDDYPVGPFCPPFTSCLPPGPPENFCGDGIVDGFEECDGAAGPFPTLNCNVLCTYDINTCTEKNTAGYFVECTEDDLLSCPTVEVECVNPNDSSDTTFVICDGECSGGPRCKCKYEDDGGSDKYACECPAGYVPDV